MDTIIVTEKGNHPAVSSLGTRVISPGEYIRSTEYLLKSTKNIVNLCDEYDYQSTGYYISLLAEARGQKVIPSVNIMIDFKLPSLIRGDAEDFDKMIQQALESVTTDTVELLVFFGMSAQPQFSKLGQLLFQLYQAPILKAVFNKRTKWQLSSLKPGTLDELKNGENDAAFQVAYQNYLLNKKVTSKQFIRKKYDLGILVNPEEPVPPSDPAAIKNFVSAAENQGFNVHFIGKNDFNKLIQLDALFIRETTQVNHHTYRFARKAEYEGIPVIDDPVSILKCSNKVYLQDLLKSQGIGVPNSEVYIKSSKQILPELGFPIILKTPDGAFSKGVKKVTNQQEFDLQLKAFFQHSELVIGQQFMPTEYDWRVGIIGGKPLYVCKYYMARDHWQIINWAGKESRRFGKSETFAIDDVPRALISTAINSSKLIGNGLYGVDIKEVDGKFYVIEINDNPSIDSGVEDKVGKKAVYNTIIQHILHLIEQ